MKNITKSISLLSLVLLAMVLINCGGGGGETAPEKVALGQLKKTWSIKTVNGAKLGNTDRTGDFSGFTLTITGTYSSNSPSGPYSFNVSGSMPDPTPWPTNGTWTFAGEPAKNSGLILRDDGVSIAYSINSANELTLNFTYTNNARVSQVDGNWTFVLE